MKTDTNFIGWTLRHSFASQGKPAGAIGGMLSQENQAGQNIPIRFYSAGPNCLWMATANPRITTLIAKRSQTIVMGETSASATLVARTRVTHSSGRNINVKYFLLPVLIGWDD